MSKIHKANINYVTYLLNMQHICCLYVNTSWVLFLCFFSFNIYINAWWVWLNCNTFSIGLPSRHWCCRPRQASKNWGEKITFAMKVIFLLTIFMLMPMFHWVQGLLYSIVLTFYGNVALFWRYTAVLYCHYKKFSGIYSLYLNYEWLQYIILLLFWIDSTNNNVSKEQNVF